MQKIVECVPNFSEGRDPSVIRQITSEIESVEGVRLLDVSPGIDTNRTVVTFAGEPDAAVEAAFRAIRKAASLIRMTGHRGAHPRMGATDVCPFIPVSGVTMEDCVECAKRLGARVGGELGIPVYLYGEAATLPDRVRLPDIRAGEYEGLAEKMKRPDFRPDFGPAEFNPVSGATAVGARDFMLAYNVNLNTTDARFAKEIAATLRESGRARRDREGRIVKDEGGNAVMAPGRLKFCQAGGWFMEAFGCAQVTMNLHRYRVTGLHTAFDAVCEEAVKLGLRVTGSELVGLAPLGAVLDAGRHYLGRQGKCTGIPEPAVVHAAVHSLGLGETAPFKPEERIVEYCLGNRTGRLAGLEVGRFVDELSSDSPAPGGGSVSALSAALSAALCAMVANLTFGKKESKRRNALMEEIAVKAQILKARFVELVDEDTAAFNSVMAAMRLPKITEAEKTTRDAALQEAAKRAALAPFETLERAAELTGLADTLIRRGNPNAASDAGTASAQALAAAEGAWLNVAINLPMIRDTAFTGDLRSRADAALDRVRKGARRNARLLLKRLAA
jgi:glutamate formiminotransferase / formiminotetrahydrofolate cyclodeaminase